MNCVMTLYVDGESFLFFIFLYDTANDDNEIVEAAINELFKEIQIA